MGNAGDFFIQAFNNHLLSQGRKRAENRPKSGCFITFRSSICFQDPFYVLSSIAHTEWYNPLRIRVPLSSGSIHAIMCPEDKTPIRGGARRVHWSAGLRDNLSCCANTGQVHKRSLGFVTRSFPIAWQAKRTSAWEANIVPHFQNSSGS